MRGEQGREDPTWKDRGARGPFLMGRMPISVKGYSALIRTPARSDLALRVRTNWPWLPMPSRARAGKMEESEHHQRRDPEPPWLAAPGPHHPGRDGSRHLRMAARPRRRLAPRLHGGRVGHRARQRGGAPAPGRRHRRSPPPRHRGVPRPGRGRARARPLLRSVGQAGLHALPTGGDAEPRGAAHGARPHRSRSLRGGGPRPRGPPGAGGDQPADQGQGADPAHPLRGHARRRRLHPDGRRHPPRDPRGPRRLRRGPGRQPAPPRRPHHRRAGADAPLRPRGRRLRCGAAPPARLPPHRLRGLAGGHAPPSLDR